MRVTRICTIAHERGSCSRQLKPTDAVADRRHAPEAVRCDNRSGGLMGDLTKQARSFLAGECLYFKEADALWRGLRDQENEPSLARAVLARLRDSGRQGRVLRIHRCPGHALRVRIVRSRRRRGDDTRCTGNRLAADRNCGDDFASRRWPDSAASGQDAGGCADRTEREPGKTGGAICSSAADSGAAHVLTCWCPSTERISPALNSMSH